MMQRAADNLLAQGIVARRQVGQAAFG